MEEGGLNFSDHLAGTPLMNLSYGGDVTLQ
jgi:hypothetical protein